MSCKTDKSGNEPASADIDEASTSQVKDGELMEIEDAVKEKDALKEKDTLIEKEDALTEKEDAFKEEEDGLDVQDEDEQLSASDPYTKHFEYTLPEEGLPEDLTKNRMEYQIKHFDFPEIGSSIYAMPELFSTQDPTFTKSDISEFSLKKNLLTPLLESPKKFSSLQMSFLNLISDYYDVTYMQRTPTRGKELREVYTLHILNHILKSRAKIIHHNSKLSRNPDEEYRDQGFTRPTALILVPMRHDCYCIVQLLSKLLPTCAIMKKKRFDKEYGPPPKRVRKKKKPQDYEDTFEGNIDEDFKIGLRVTNKTVTLYSEFYGSDLIIASPLGLRQILGAEGDKDQDYDFLSSIEILVMDRLDVMYIQNLVHLLHVLKHLNRLPKKTHDCNFFRVRMYALDEKAKFFRQNILLSAVEHNWFESDILQNFCPNYKGYVRTISSVKCRGISQIFDKVTLYFRFFEFTDPREEFEDRFNFFINKVLPDFKAPEMAQTLLYIPSYYDYVRLRNYFRANELSACMVCEYTDSGKVAEARNNFFKGRRHFMLYTERAHFYHRYNIKGIQHILFYQPPTYPMFFRELNFAFLDSNPRRKYQEKTCTLVLSKQDVFQLKQLVGMNETRKMFNSERDVFVKFIDG